VPPDAPAAAEPDAAAASDAAPEPAKTSLERAMDDRRFDDAVMLCNRRFGADVAAACTLAACHERLEGKVRAWFQKTAPAERPHLIGLCRSLGIDPVTHRPPPPPAKPDAGIEDKCEKNPMACQH
jgi:hypothetical protein